MFFGRKNKYEMNMDTANTILQNVFASESKIPNTVPFDKLVLRQKANTRFYDRILIILFLVLLLTFLSPLAFTPLTGNPNIDFLSNLVELVNMCYW